ncbi:hypothetical protein [Marinicella rhabdoformis]|uniref:hypothetical protein n=1 Tax=Marinicella rhabdoformis TaxID=2580566 RepID=UPI0012AEC08D|nr:hypothetical protein [Marinicella rhabdoformis]
MKKFVLLSLLLTFFSASAENKYSYLWGIQFPALITPDTPCCFDYDGDGVNDDGLGAALALMSELNENNYQQIADRILLDNEVVKAFHWHGLNLAQDNNNFTFQITDATINNPEVGFIQRYYGYADLTIDTALTHNLFSGELMNRKVTATAPMLTNFLRMEGPFGDDALTLYDVKFEADLVEDEGLCQGVCTEQELKDQTVVGSGKLGGVLPASEVFSAMNEQYRFCACAGVNPTQDLLTWEANDFAGSLIASCQQDVEASSCSQADYCSTLTHVCGYAPVLGLALDLDTDQDGINDAFSVGLRLGISGIDELNLLDLIFEDSFE